MARNRDVIMGLYGLCFPAIYAHRADGAAAGSGMAGTKCGLRTGFPMS